MVNRVPDATGWISETGATAPHIATAHGGIAFVAILVIALLVGQLVRPPRRENRLDHEDWD